jgi:hypothetical protein
MTDKKEKATRQVLEHIDRACRALGEAYTDPANAERVLARPDFQKASLKIAREELNKAIAIIDRTKWR